MPTHACPSRRISGAAVRQVSPRSKLGWSGSTCTTPLKFDGFDGRRTMILVV
jgi:hypothetical protein